MRGDLLVRPDAAVDPNARSGGRRVTLNPTGRGHEVPQGILGVDPEFDGVATRRGITLGWNPLATSDPNLLAHQVDAEHRLGNRMLDLQSGVHLEEVEVLARHDELDGPGVLVTDSRSGLDRRFRHGAAARVGQTNRRRLLQKFLMPPLDGTLAFAKREGGAVAIGEDLHLDVTRVRQITLEVDIRAGEGCLRRATAGLKGGGELLSPLGHPHSDPAAARRGFDEHRITDPRRLRNRCLLVAQGGGPRHDGDAGLDHSATSLDFVAHRPHAGRRRADKGQAVARAGLREPGILGKEPVAGMNRVSPMLPGDPNQLIDVEVDLARRWPG